MQVKTLHLHVTTLFIILFATSQWFVKVCCLPLIVSLDVQLISIQKHTAVKEKQPKSIESFAVYNLSLQLMALMHQFTTTQSEERDA